MARIYLCDDDRQFVEMMTEVLKDAGHAVTGATSTDGFGRLLTGGFPDVAIFDMQMPAGGGPRLHAMLPSKVPVIVLSAMPVRYQQEWIIGRPAARFLEKPVTWLALEAAIRDLGGGAPAGAQPCSA